MVHSQEPGGGSRGALATMRYGLRRFAAHQNPHSLFIAAAGTFFAITLVIDIALHRADLQEWVLWVLVIFCSVLALIALVLGELFPLWIGLLCVIVFTIASLYFLGPLTDAQAAVSTAQELPILALYLGWFIPRPLGRIVMITVTVLFTAVLVINPAFHPDGELGVPSGVQMIVVGLFCFEIGSMLWRRSEKIIGTDLLTGVLNRAGFMKHLERELQRAARGGAAMCLVVIDFDRFKQLNDTQGHAAGDRALADTVAILRGGIRSGDAIGRTGGDEFAILLDRIDVRGADQIMRRLRQASTHPWSWGIAQVRPGEGIESVFGRADTLLYDAKRRREMQ